MRYPKQFVVLFWSKVKKSAKCWEWQRGKTKAGYGQIQCRSISQAPMLAHRVSWELKNGPIPDGLHVLHECDNPACVRPKHLFLGTQIDNNNDRDRKGRVASGNRNGARTRRGRNPFVRNRGSGLKNEKHPMAKLTDAQVEELRREFASGVIKRHLAKKYGISETHTGRLVKGVSRCL